GAPGYVRRMVRGRSHCTQSRIRSEASRALILSPTVGVLREPGSLDPHDAEALPGRCLHDYPSLESLDYGRAQLRQARHFGLDVEVDPALVIDALDLHDGLIGRSMQHDVIAACARVVAIHGTTQRASPELGRLFQIGGLAVNEHGAKAGLVHRELP